MATLLCGPHMVAASHGNLPEVGEEGVGGNGEVTDEWWGWADVRPSSCPSGRM